MATGTSGYAGLAMGLFGEHQITQVAIANDILTITSATSNTSDYLVLEDVDGSEQLYINYLGAIYVRNEITDTAGVGAYMGIDARTTINDGATGTWYAGCGFRLTNNQTDDTLTAQFYAGNFHYVGGAAGSHNYGRLAVINLINNISTGYKAPTWNNAAFINMSDAGDIELPSLISMPDTTESSGGCLTARGSITGTHGLSCNFGGTQYYIMVATTS